MLSPHPAGLAIFSVMPWVRLTFSYSVLFKDVSVRNLQLKIQNTNQFPLVTATSFLPAEWGSFNDAVTFFLTWKIPRLHSYTNFLPEWFLVRGQYPYFFFLFIARWFDFLWHAAFFPPSNSLTEKNYILKPIPASFIMKVRAEMATEWTPRMFFFLYHIEITNVEWIIK